MAVAAAIVIGAGATAFSAREQRQASGAQIRAQKEREARQQTLLAEQQATEERTRTRDIQRTTRRRRAGAATRQRSTVLTGPLGIQESAPGTQGGKTLLGM